MAELASIERVAMAEARSAEAACDGIICFAGVDWWYHNRGHSECQLMIRLAKLVPVLWVNSIGMRAPMPGRTELPFKRYVRKAKSTLKGLKRDESGMWVYSPLFVPRYTPRMVRLNGLLLAMQVKFWSRRLGIRRPSVFVTVPTAAYAFKRGRWRSSVFNRSDEFSAFGEASAEFIRPLEKMLLEGSDVVYYVNRRLFERERGQVRDARYLGHGVDFDKFADARRHATPANMPERMRGLAGPIVGFYGALDDYTVDLELLIKMARHPRTGTLLVIGPKAMDISRLEKEPKVVYLGPVPYSEVANYAAHFDVALMPWLQNDWIAGCNPIKLKEYLALGFPIVTMKFPELAPYEHLVYSAATHEEFLTGLDRALDEQGETLTEARRKAVVNDSWDSLAQRVAQTLHLPAKE